MSDFVKYKVKDISSRLGKKRDYPFAESEMPGLMALRKEYKHINL